MPNKPDVQPGRRGPRENSHFPGMSQNSTAAPSPRSLPCPCSLFPDPALGLRSAVGSRLGWRREPQEEASGGREAVGGASVPGCRQDGTL